MSSHVATLEFIYESTDVARIVAESVVPEVDELADERSRTAVERAGRTVTITVHARDLSALRAGLNTWFALADVAEVGARVGSSSDTRV